MKQHTTGKAGIQKPTDPYDPAWHDYNRQNPHVFKSVGAEAAGEGEGEGEGTQPDLNDPAIQEAIRKATDEQVKGLKAKNSELLGKVKEANDHLKAWEGLDPEQVKGLMQRINADEETRLMSEGKLDEVLAKRTERMKADFGSQLGSRDKRIQELEQAMKAKDEQLDRIVIDGAVRDAAIKAGLVPSAVEDAVIRGRSMFVRDEHGNPIARDAGGDLVMSKDGKSALGPSEWLESMKDNASHWWPPSTGGGTQPGRAGSERIKNPWKKDSFNLTEQGRIFKENPDLAARLKNEATNH